jgi:alanine dehydrogenase
MLLLRPDDVRGIISMRECVEAAEGAFRDWGEDNTLNWPRRRVHLPSSVRVSVHQGGAKTAGASGLFTHCELVRPRSEHQDFEYIAEPVYVLFNGASGVLDCIIVGEVTCSELPDIRAVTGLRTAATAAVGTRLLARETVDVCGMFGCGNQGWQYLLAVAQVRPIRRVLAYRRTPEALRTFCRDVEQRLGIECRPAEGPRQVMEGSDLVLCATSSSVPVFEGSWLRPGQHVTTLVGSNNLLVRGGFTPRKRRETDDETVRRADLILATSKPQAIQDEQGALWDPVQAGIITWDKVHDLSEVAAGRAPLRTRPEQISLFVNNAGQGIVDVAIGRRVYEIARERGLGLEVDAPGLRSGDYYLGAR